MGFGFFFDIKKTKEIDESKYKKHFKKLSPKTPNFFKVKEKRILTSHSGSNDLWVTKQDKKSFCNILW